MTSPSTCSIVGDVVRCVNFAAIKHKDQRRKDAVKTPYINHPIGKATEVKLGQITIFRSCYYTSALTGNYPLASNVLSSKQKKLCTLLKYYAACMSLVTSTILVRERLHCYSSPSPPPKKENKMQLVSMARHKQIKQLCTGKGVF